MGPWLTPVLHGALISEELEHNNSMIIRLSLLSRRSCEHAGTRFKARGMDDVGSCANFVESEQRMQLIVRYPYDTWAVASLVQLRGSAPLFWDQRGKAITPKPRLRRSVPLTLPALRRHLNDLERRYGMVTLLSLLEHKGDELEIQAALTQAISAVEDSHSSVRLAAFDFRNECRKSRQEGVRVRACPFKREQRAGEMVLAGYRLVNTYMHHTRSVARVAARVTAIAIATMEGPCPAHSTS